MEAKDDIVVTKTIGASAQEMRESDGSGEHIAYPVYPGEEGEIEYIRSKIVTSKAAPRYEMGKIEEQPKNIDLLRGSTPEELRNALIKYFERWAGIGDSYIYDLTRVKEAFEIGTVSLEDFVEWDEERIEILVDEFIAWLHADVEEE